MAFTLAVNIHEDFAKLSQQSYGYRFVVHVSLAGTFPLQTPCDNDLWLFQLLFEDTFDGSS